MGSGAWLLVGLAAAPSAALWAMASARWSQPALLVVALIVQAAGIALPALVGGAVPALIGAVAFGGTFIGVSTMALAAGRMLAFPGAVAVLTAGYSVGQIVGPLMVTPLLHHGFRPRYSPRRWWWSASAAAAAWLRVGLPGTQPPPRGAGRRTGSHTPGAVSSEQSTSAVKASITACINGFGSPRRHTSDHVQIGIGRCTGRRVRSGGVASFWPLGLFSTGRRSRRTWSKKVEPVTPPSSTRTTCAPDSRANCSAKRFHDDQLASSESNSTVRSRASTGAGPRPALNA